MLPYYLPYATKQGGEGLHLIPIQMLVSLKRGPETFSSVTDIVNEDAPRT